MKRHVAIVVALACFFPSANAASRRFAKYKKIEAYEVRPDILMLPTYSRDGRVCEIGLEMLHYSPQSVMLSSSMSRKEIDQVFNELVSAKERGPRSKDFSRDVIVEDGGGRTRISVFKNVVLKIYSRVASTVGGGEPTEPNLVATIEWIHRKCR